NLGSAAASISGPTSLTGAGWGLVIRPLHQPGPVFDPGSGGAAILSCGDGAEANWPGLAKRLRLSSIYLLAEGAELQVVGGAAGARRIPSSIPAWSNSNDADPGIPLLQLFSSEPASLAFVGYREERAGRKVLTVSGSIHAKLAVLRTAAGNSLEVRAAASLK